MVWTADGRPHPAFTRTLHYAATVAATRNSKQTTASSLLDRWRHEIQIAILQRRAAVLRAVLPKPSAFEQWPLTGNIEGASGIRGREEAIIEGDPDEIARGEDTDGAAAEDTDRSAAA